MAKKKKDDLDTETTIADMNVDGFRWYDPHRKKNDASAREKRDLQLTKKEKRAMVRGAFVAALPLVGCVVVALLAVFGLAFLWLK